MKPRRTRLTTKSERSERSFLTAESDKSERLFRGAVRLRMAVQPVHLQFWSSRQKSVLGWKKKGFGLCQWWHASEVQLTFRLEKIVLTVHIQNLACIFNLMLRLCLSVVLNDQYMTWHPDWRISYLQALMLIQFTTVHHWRWKSERQGAVACWQMKTLKFGCPQRRLLCLNLKKVKETIVQGRRLRLDGCFHHPQHQRLPTHAR